MILYMVQQEQQERDQKQFNRVPSCLTVPVPSHMYDMYLYALIEFRSAYSSFIFAS